MSRPVTVATSANIPGIAADPASGSVAGTVNIRSSEVIAVIDSRMTKEMLDDLQKKLAEQGYKFKVDRTSYKDNVLESISASIRDKTNDTQFSASGFKKIIIRKITSEEGKKSIQIFVHDGTVSI